MSHILFGGVGYAFLSEVCSACSIMNMILLLTILFILINSILLFRIMQTIKDIARTCPNNMRPMLVTTSLMLILKLLLICAREVCVLISWRSCLGS